MKSIVSKTPVRIAFGGGGTDVEPYSSDYGGFVINATVSLFNRCFFNSRNDKSIVIKSNYSKDPIKFSIRGIQDDKDYRIMSLYEAIFYLLKPSSGFDIYIHSQIPQRAGLGSSASLSVSIIAGILESTKISLENLDQQYIAEIAYQVEQEILKNEGGRQDQYASVFGGFNGIKFNGGSNVQVKRLNLSKSFKEKLERSLILFYTGIPHISGNLVERQVNFYEKEKNKAKLYLDELKRVAYELRDALKSEDFNLFGSLLTKDLKIKKQFNPLLSTDYLDTLYEKIIQNGAIGGRIIGAGGGGCMIWLVHPKKKDIINSILEKEKGKRLEYNFTDEGLKIIEI
ncbi:MAG: hypothetical protein P8Y70_15205 [Candidatus Lokiarchaeota archaeon]